jgi:methyl-accepting chemotaxis protein
MARAVKSFKPDTDPALLSVLRDIAASLDLLVEAQDQQAEALASLTDQVEQMTAQVGGDYPGAPRFAALRTLPIRD